MRARAFGRKSLSASGQFDLVELIAIVDRFVELIVLAKSLACESSR